MKLKIIGITGIRGAGKDTFINHLRTISPYVIRYAFADRLKSDIKDLCEEQFGVNPFILSAEDKEIVRHLFIGYGMAWRAKDPLHWAKLVAKHIEEDTVWPSPTVPAISDIRFTNECELFREKYGKKFFLLSLSRAGGPPPTEEEEKHHRQVSAMADHAITWGGDTETQQLETVKAFAELINL